MSDNVELASGSGGAVISTDEVTPGVHTQRVKVQFGTDGNATDASSSNPLPVTVSGVTGTVALPTGAATAAAQATQITHLAAIETAVEGTLAVSAASLPLPSGAATAAKQPALGTAGSPSADVITVQGHASGVALKVDGSAVTQPISAASLPLPSGAATSANQTTELAHLAAIETAVEGTLTVGTHAVTQSGTWGVRCQDGSGNALTSKSVGSERAMSVAIVDGSGAQITSFGGGTQYTEGDTDATITGTAMLWEDTSDTLRAVSAAKPLPVNIVSGAGSGGTASTDDAAFTAASGSGTPIMGFVTADSVDSGDVGVLGMLANRQLKVTLFDSGGSELSVGGGTQYDEDTASAAAEKLTMAGVVRKDTAASSVDTDGDRTVLAVDSTGRLHVNVGNTVTVGSHAVTNAGTFAVQAAQSGTWNVTNISGTVSLPTGAATAAKQPALGTAGSASSDVITVQGVTSMTPLLVNGSGVTQPVSGTVTVQDGGNTITVDNGGTFATQVTSLPASTNTIEVVGDAAHDAAASGNPVLIGAYASATAPSDVADADAVRIWADRAGRVQVGDGGGSLTVDGSVTVSGTVTANAGTNLNTSALALESGGNLATLAGAVSSSRVAVNVISGQAGVQGGSGSVSATTQRVVLATDVALPAGTNNIGDVDVLTLPGVAGDVAHDASDSGNPIKVGFKAANALPTAVANGDRANGISDLFGRQLVASIDSAQQVWKSANYTTTQTGTTIWDPTSGKKFVITYMSIATYGTTAARVILYGGANGDNTYSAGTDQLFFAGSFVPSASATPGAIIQPPVPLFSTTADHELKITTDAGISIDIVCFGYEI